MKRQERNAVEKNNVTNKTAIQQRGKIGAKDKD